MKKGIKIARENQWAAWGEKERRTDAFFLQRKWKRWGEKRLGKTFGAFSSMFVIPHIDCLWYSLGCCDYVNKSMPCSLCGICLRVIQFLFSSPLSVWVISLDLISTWFFPPIRKPIDFNMRWGSSQCFL